MTTITIAKAVMEDPGITPIIEPIRGGTDGSKISFMGIPTPNIFADGENMKGRFEYVSLQTMERAVDTIIGIVTIKAKRRSGSATSPFFLFYWFFLISSSCRRFCYFIF